MKNCDDQKPDPANERRRAELIAAGRIRPRRTPKGLADRSPLPAIPDMRPLSELLIEMREQERT